MDIKSAQGTEDYQVKNPGLMITDIANVHRMAYSIKKQGSSAQIVDARAAPRFLGEVPEPRKGVRSGNISGSINLPFMELVD